MVNSKKLAIYSVILLIAIGVLAKFGIWNFDLPNTIITFGAISLALMYI